MRRAGAPALHPHLQWRPERRLTTPCAQCVSPQMPRPALHLAEVFCVVWSICSCPPHTALQSECARVRWFAKPCLRRPANGSGPLFRQACLRTRLAPAPSSTTYVVWHVPHTIAAIAGRDQSVSPRPRRRTRLSASRGHRPQFHASAGTSSSCRTGRGSTTSTTPMARHRGGGGDADIRSYWDRTSFAGIFVTAPLSFFVQLGLPPTCS